MSQRFFVEPPITGETATLADAEAHHLIHVMRACPGDEVTLFDGSGAEFASRITKLGRTSVDVAVLSRREISRELPFDLTLGVAMPRGDRQKWLVEKATELGVTRLVPLVTARSVAEPGSGTLDKLRRAVIESAKQCGRNRLMQIAPPQPWSDFLAAAPADALRVVAHPTIDTSGSPLSSPIDPSTNAVLVAIGPEGGFTDEEIAGATQGGWQLVGLGPRILRIETAALAVVSRLTAREVSTSFSSPRS